jgi:hypothetical protein
VDTSQKLAAALGYIPVLGWLYVLLTQRDNKLAVFHVRQAVGLTLFLILLVAAWALIAFAISWIPYGFLVANMLFALVIAGYIFGVIALIAGIRSASGGKPLILPIVGKRALKLPIGSL